MEDLDVSPQFKTTSLSVPSPTGTHIVSLNGARLQIQLVSSLETVRSIPLPASQDLRKSHLVWSSPQLSLASDTTPDRKRPSPRSDRIAVWDETSVRIYDLRDTTWNAVINNGSGGMGKQVWVDFGRSQDEIVVWSDFCAKATIWCLRSGRSVEIRDPKFMSAGKGWGYRPRNDGTEGRGGVLAALCRSDGKDTLLLMAAGSYSILKKVELVTVDAQGLKWSRDGRWIAVWEAPAHGFQLHIYTADGHLYRSLNREIRDEDNEFTIDGLGIKSVEWVPGNDWLAVGGWDCRVRIYSTKTFSPMVYLDHMKSIHHPSTQVYAEKVDGRGIRTYTLEHQPITPPPAQMTPNDTFPKQGISLLSFNNDATLVATRDDSTPTTVWIWDLKSLAPKTIIIQYSPVKSMQWHPLNADLLLIQTTADSPTAYLWTAPAPSNPAEAPDIIPLATNISKPAGSLPGKWDAKLLSTPTDKKPIILFGHQQSHIFVYPHGKDQILRFESPDGDESEDSLYDILTGKTPVPQLHEPEEFSGDFDIMDDGRGSTTGSFDDTFRAKRGRGMSGGGRSLGMGMDGADDRSELYESGMDEMF